jgi:hypothetical protein
MLEYTVIGYNEIERCHKCKINNKIRLVDLMINGDFPEETNPESLIGKTIEAEWEHPYISIATNVKIKNISQ